MTALRDGEMRACNVQGEEVLVCCVGGEYFALSNRCSHAGQRLSTGRLRGYEVTCPLHRARFDVRTGAAVSAPATQGIRRYPVLLEGGKITIAVG